MFKNKWRVNEKNGKPAVVEMQRKTFARWQVQDTCPYLGSHFCKRIKPTILQNKQTKMEKASAKKENHCRAKHICKHKMHGHKNMQLL